MDPEDYYGYPGPPRPGYNAGGGYRRFPQPAGYPQYVPGGVEYRHFSQPHPVYYPPGCRLADRLPGRGMVGSIFARYRDSIWWMVDSQLSEAYMEFSIANGVAPGGAYRPPPYTASHGGFDYGGYSFGGGGYRGEYDTARWAEDERYHAREDDRVRRALGMPVEDTYYEEDDDIPAWAEHARECDRTCPACIFLAREEYDGARYDTPLRHTNQEANDRLRQAQYIYAQEEHDEARRNATRRHANQANNERLRRAREASEDEEYDEGGYESPPQRSGQEEEGQFRRADMSPGVGTPSWTGSNWDGTQANTSGRQTPPARGPNPTISDGLRAAGSPALTVIAARTEESTRSEAGTQTDATSSWMDPTDPTMAPERGESRVLPEGRRDS